MIRPAIDIVRRIESQKPDLVLSVVYGKANWVFIHQLRVRGPSEPQQRYRASRSASRRQEMRKHVARDGRDYVCSHYFQGVESAANARFIERLKASAKFERESISCLRRDGVLVRGGSSLGEGCREGRNAR